MLRRVAALKRSASKPRLVWTIPRAYSFAEWLTVSCEWELPGVTVPAGYHASGAPFGLIFVGSMWSEAMLLSLAYDYECATKHRRPPVLTA